MATKMELLVEGTDFESFEDDDYDDFEGDTEFEFDDLSLDIHIQECASAVEPGSRLNARREIEYRREMQQLYSQLNDWEEFGESERLLRLSPKIQPDGALEHRPRFIRHGRS